MNRLFSLIVLIVSAAVLVACNEVEVGQNLEAAGGVAKTLGGITQLAVFSLGGSALSLLGTFLQGKKASVGAAYAKAPFTLEEGDEILSVVDPHKLASKLTAAGDNLTRS